MKTRREKRLAVDFFLEQIALQELRQFEHIIGFFSLFWLPSFWFFLGKTGFGTWYLQFLLLPLLLAKIITQAKWFLFLGGLPFYHLHWHVTVVCLTIGKGFRFVQRIKILEPAFLNLNKVSLNWWVTLSLGLSLVKLCIIMSVS